MSKEGIDDSRYQKAEEMGHKNKTLIPSLSLWCQHIDVKGYRGSMLGDMLDIPMSTSIACPHTEGGYQGPNLEWNAKDFIIENCLNCDKHKPITADNYGVKVVSEYHQIKRKEEEEELARLDRLASLRHEAESLVVKEKTKAEIKTLSIIKLIEKLDVATECKDMADQLLQAARLSPDFFTEAAINYISLFIEKQEYGNVILETIAELQGANHRLSQFVLQNIVSAIKNSKSSDLAASIWGNSVDNNKLSTFPEVLKMVIKNCNYENFYHFGQSKAGSYPMSIKLLGRLYDADINCFNSIFHSLLNDRDTSVRIDLNGLLQDMFENETGNVIDFLPWLIRSFDFIDHERGGESGDHQTAKTIVKLYALEPEKVMEVCLLEGNKLSEWGKVELVEVYEKIALEDRLYKLNVELSKETIVRLNTFLLGDNKKDKLVEAALSAIEQVASRRSELLAIHFDTYIGFLMMVNEQRQKFDWYREDASNTIVRVATFNPLVGKNYFELENMAMDLAKVFRGAGEIIVKMVKEDSEECLPGLLEVIQKISSKTEGKFKAELIGLVQKSTKDVVSISNILPQIYGYLHDIDSEDVRFVGMKFIVHLTERYPQLITNTMIETIKVFFDDQVVGVRGLAVEAYGQIIQQFPEHIDKKCFDHIHKLISDKYVFVHKAAISSAYNVYPFLSKPERTLWMIDLYRYADFYLENDDFSYALEVVKGVLYFAAEEPQTHKRVVTSMLVKLCHCKDYYVEKDALSYLTSLTRSKKDYGDFWIKEAIGFLGKTLTKWQHQSNDDRKEVFQFFYELDEANIIKHTDLIIGHVKSSIDSIKVPIIPDVIHFHSIFAYFNMWQTIKELSLYFRDRVPEKPKFDAVHKFNQRSLRIAETEIQVGSATINLRDIQSLVDARS